ncbi:prepilin peptidase [Cellulosimicrobium protaetiae]|uniref:Prepilin peptidase n=1 Tax=Cellulosimicrobium protaetiae TaxID=2587808 RepID=A0A6M5UHR1_9MICO|nr:A24 family peptidase [Cellulosimicrobium protaetiae]QJW36855.1 prepilin peptidase [Cellulosimicrobium protaetiae]
MVEQGDGTTTDDAPLRSAAPVPGAPGVADDERSWARRRGDLVARELRLAGPVGVVLAVLAAAGTARWSGPSWATPALALVAAAGAVVAVVDARTHRLPDVIVLPTWLGAVLLLVVAAAVGDDGAALVRALAGGVVGFGAYAALRIAYPPGLGFGDVKLAGMLGTPLAWFGWGELVAGLVLPFLLGGAWALGLVVLRRARRDTAVPFGPFMVAGSGLAAVLGDAALRAYAGA